MNNKVYDILKWIAIVGLDAIGVAYSALAEIWNLPYGNEICKTVNIIGAALGTLLGVSAITYNSATKDKTEE